MNHQEKETKAPTVNNKPQSNSPITKSPNSSNSLLPYQVTFQKLEGSGRSGSGHGLWRMKDL